MSRSNPSVGSIALVTALLIITFALIGFVTLSIVADRNFGIGGSSSLDHPTPRPGSTAAEAVALGTPDPSARVTFKSVALGFGLEYPRDWLKNEQGLRISFSPATAGPDVDIVREPILWVGIPPDGTTNLDELSARLQADLSPNPRRLSRESVVIGDQTWSSTKISFENDQLDGPAIATIATTTKNEVSYFVIAVAPAEEWDAVQPIFQDIMGSFHFTSEAVLRPTDATPPPTPTPTPTPVIHVVQSGDTLSHISARYGVTIDALSARNGIEDPRRLRVGMKLIIPIKRR